MFVVYIGKGSYSVLWSALVKGPIVFVVYIGKGSYSVCGLHW